MKCPYCGSERIETGIAWGKATMTDEVGLRYKAKGFFPLGVAQVYSDLCLDCKSIVTYIKEDTDKNWTHDPGNM